MRLSVFRGHASGLLLPRAASLGRLAGVHELLRNLRAGVLAKRAVCDV